MFPLINKDIEKWKEKNFSYEVVQNMNVKSHTSVSKNHHKHTTHHKSHSR